MILHPRDNPVDFESLPWANGSRALVLLAPYVVALFIRFAERTADTWLIRYAHRENGLHAVYLYAVDTPLCDRNNASLLRLPKKLSIPEGRGYNSKGVIIRTDTQSISDYAYALSQRSIRTALKKMTASVEIDILRDIYGITPFSRACN